MIAMSLFTCMREREGGTEGGRERGGGGGGGEREVTDFKTVPPHQPLKFHPN